MLGPQDVYFGCLLTRLYIMGVMAHDDNLQYFCMRCACASEDFKLFWCTMRFESTTKVPAKRMLKYYRISWWDVAVQLRDLVPPQSQAAISADKDESKRPKHVVLSDTIALVKELRVKVIYL